MRLPEGDHRDVGQAGLRALGVGARKHVVDVVEEQRAGADDGEVVLARLDDRVAGLVAVEFRVEEVDDDLAAGEPTLLVDVLAEGLHRVAGARVRAGRERCVDVGDHRDVDLGRRDADLGGGGLLGGARRAWRGRWSPRRMRARRDDDTSLHHELRFPLGPKASSEYV